MEREVTLFGMWASPLSLRIEWALTYKGVSYEYIDEDLNNKSQRLLMYNPIHKKIPVLVHAEKPIAESLVILEYIDGTWINNPLMPQHPYQRAMARFWAKYCDDKCWTTITTLFSSTGEDQENAKKEASTCLKRLENLLAGNKFFAGVSIGYLDIVIGWIAYWVPLIEDVIGLSIVDEASMPALKAWFQEFLNVSWIKQVLPPQPKMLPHLKELRNKVLMSNP